MYNLIRMDIRRMMRSRSLYVCLAVLVCSGILSFVMVYGIANPDAREKLEAAGVTLTVTNQDALENMNQISVLEMVDQGGVRGGMFACVTGILAAIFICGEFESGFVKNIFAIYEKKWKYVLSKLCCLCMVNLFFLLAMFISILVLNLVTGSFFQQNTMEGILVYMVSAWMLHNAFSALYLMISIVTRSKAAGVAAGIFLGSGTIVALLSSVLGLVGWNKFLDYTIYFTLGRCPMIYEKLTDLEPVMTGMLFLIGYTVISGLVVQKKDI